MTAKAEIFTPPFAKGGTGLQLIYYSTQLAARAGIEPATSALTARRSTTELPSINLSSQLDRIYFNYNYNQLQIKHPALRKPVLKKITNFRTPKVVSKIVIII